MFATVGSALWFSWQRQTVAPHHGAWILDVSDRWKTVSVDVATRRYYRGSLGPMSHFHTFSYKTKSYVCFHMKIAIFYTYERPLRESRN